MASSIKVTQNPKTKVVLVNDDTVAFSLEVWPSMKLVVITASGAPPATTIAPPNVPQRMLMGFGI